MLLVQETVLVVGTPAEVEVRMYDYTAQVVHPEEAAAAAAAEAPKREEWAVGRSSAEVGSYFDVDARSVQKPEVVDCAATAGKSLLRQEASAEVVLACSIVEAVPSAPRDFPHERMKKP